MKKTILYALFMLLAVIGAQAQEITVSGTVLSGSDNEPLIGASVRAVATNAGTSTDIDGNFTIKVPRDPTCRSHTSDMSRRPSRPSPR